MKRFIIAVFALATICTVSCKKESVNPETQSVKKVSFSGGGDKRPSGTYD